MAAPSGKEQALTRSQNKLTFAWTTCHHFGSLLMAVFLGGTLCWGQQIEPDGENSITVGADDNIEIEPSIEDADASPLGETPAASPEGFQTDPSNNGAGVLGLAIDIPEGSLFALDLSSVTILDVRPKGPNIRQPDDGRVLLPNQLLFDPQEHNAVVIRWLDKVTTQIATETVPVNASIQFGTLSVSVDACLKNPSTQTPEAAAYFRVSEALRDSAPIQRFAGWMFASSPALNALDHAIYDVWVMDCTMVERMVPASDDTFTGERAAPEEVTGAPDEAAQDSL